MSRIESISFGFPSIKYSISDRMFSMLNLPLSFSLTIWLIFISRFTKTLRFLELLK